MKKGIKSVSCLDKATKLPLKNNVSEKKAHDVKKLMDYFDASSEEAQIFYKTVFENNCLAKDKDNVESQYYDEESILE